MPNIAIIKHWMDKAESLEKQLMEKESMIDWLSAECASNIPVYFDGFVTKEEWRKEAQEAVKKNEN